MLQGIQAGCELSRLGGLLLTLLVAIMRHFPHAEATTVYFNSYGHCIQDYFPLDDEPYRVKAVGAAAIHESLICHLTFKAPPSTGVCLTFNSFHITDCGVSLSIYHDSSASGRQWRKLSCEDNIPHQMCTPERYVTLKLAKRKLNSNKNYQFDISVEKSSNLTGEDVILASSIGLFVGIIAGVVALIAVTSVIVLCCCCKPCKSRAPPQGYAAPGGGGHGHPPAIHLHPPSSTHSYPAEPSAPPVTEVSDEYTPLQQGPLYPALPQPYPDSHVIPADPPPPYAPPPYEQHAYPTKD
ncbi:hypothetical protein BaRGS_00005154 [Batillaria attramentaria]|uniref:Uncharacterized protein n=1 Tax=Batillaria attramentaria TaxID=370345 RepID=A0ABD0LVE7_9CAEN